MAFTGIPVVQRVSDRMYRITGISLEGGAAGTIGLAGGTGEIDILDAPEWTPYEDVTLQDAVSLRMVPVTDATNWENRIRVVKTGTTQANFLITLTNDDTEEQASPELEFYVEFH
jgi:hypothetical protein